MNLVPRLIELVRALLLRLSDSSHATRVGLPAAGPHIPARHAPCGVWEAALATARRRRAPHLWPAPALPAVEDDAITGVLVRAYVRPEDEQTRRLTSPQGRAW